jgi:hypothetical protein
MREGRHSRQHSRRVDSPHTSRTTLLGVSGRWRRSKNSRCGWTRARCLWMARAGSAKATGLSPSATTRAVSTSVTPARGTLAICPGRACTVRSDSAGGLLVWHETQGRRDRVPDCRAFASDLALDGHQSESQCKPKDQTQACPQTGALIRFGNHRVSKHYQQSPASECLDEGLHSPG